MQESAQVPASLARNLTLSRVTLQHCRQAAQSTFSHLEHKVGVPVLVLHAEVALLADGQALHMLEQRLQGAGASAPGPLSQCAPNAVRRSPHPDPLLLLRDVGDALGEREAYLSRCVHAAVWQSEQACCAP